MLLSRGLREQLAVNERNARLGDAAETVLAALADPRVVTAVESALALRAVRRERIRPQASSIAEASGIKAARLAAGRGQRG